MLLKLYLLISLFLALAVFETFFQRRHLTVSKTVRWYSNIGTALINNMFIFFAFPFTLTSFAQQFEDKAGGILQLFPIPYWIKIILALILLDLLIYFQHRLFHYVPAFWRFHSVHHTDVDIDLTTGMRFHPIEIFVSFCIKTGAIWALGAPALAVIIFETILSGTSMFSHSNINLHLKLDRILRLFIITPDMHRIHHSIKPKETDTNFGFNLSLWDRLFNTYLSNPEDSHGKMKLGLNWFREIKYQHLHYLLVQPLLKRN